MSNGQGGGPPFNTGNISERKWFAGQALNGMLSASGEVRADREIDKDFYASVAYAFADAMVRQGESE